MENFSIVTTRAALEQLGWGYDGWDYLESGEEPDFDHVRIDHEQGKTTWTPCNIHGEAFGDTHSTGDDKKSIQDALALLKAGMAYEL